MGGAGGLGMGCQWLAGLVCRVCPLRNMDGRGWEGGWGCCQWLAGLVSRICL